MKYKQKLADEVGFVSDSTELWLWYYTHFNFF